ncbi:hypothetical protein B0I37DRAFT_431983 [Chaetomium sp. MPI-CAGE-AT-0009]|nr:hypothetical protein B0I37DRAFT_431983 [Chaetomium sp. MPI-CAGE-AT-0009]
MKFILALTSLLGAAVAFKSSGSEERTARLRNRAPRPEKLAGVEVKTLEYRTSIGAPTEQRSKALLTRVPGLQRRGAPQASDFFECTNPNPSPATADCKVIVNQVLSTDDEFIIAANSCLVYSFGTCQAFFCSLCETLSTTTTFIGSQLDTVDALCVENGQAGTIVGEDAPQWDAGFTYAGEGLPTFDVC